ncbi:MAG: rhodanese-like domain-containing protein [Acidobacteriota bacterium]|nr:rhodanese-like domain-containing protein [Acidobacteriota bacterium]
MSICPKVLAILIALASMNAINASSEIKTREEISHEAKSKAPHISPQQLSGYLSGTDPFILLDIRTEAEYQAGHIQGAQWFPRGRLEFYIQDRIKDPDSRVVLYCRSGGRSALATLTMKDMGYTNVVDLSGGFQEWVAQGNTFFNLHGENKVVSYQKKESR